MDDGRDNWIAPILFGVAAISLFSVARMSNQPLVSVPDEKSEFDALINYNHEIHRKLEKFLKVHSEEGIKIPDEYLDPFTLQLMEDPVLLSDYQTYNRNTALFLLKYKKNSPITGNTIIEDYIEDNTQLKACIESWLEALNLQYNKSFKIRL